MRHFVKALIICLFFTLPVGQAFPQPHKPETQPAADRAENSDVYFKWAAATVELSAGYRTDKLDWHIAGNLQGSNPNVRSELIWSDLKIYQLKLANRTVIKERVYVRGHLDYGTVVSGNNRDSDYNGDNRSQEFSRSMNGVDGNNVWDGSVGVGPRFAFFASSIVICPLVGYAISEQDLNIVDGFQAITAAPAATPIGPIAGLDSRYQTRWEGPWFGLDVLLSMPCTDGPFTAIEVIFTGEYHRVDFAAEANWNLRTDFNHPVSFSQDAKGDGLVARASVLFKMKDRWGINVGMNVTNMTTDAGLDRTYFADGTTGDTRLNQARWRSFTFEAGLSCRF